MSARMQERSRRGSRMPAHYQAPCRAESSGISALARHWRESAGRRCSLVGRSVPSANEMMIAQAASGACPADDSVQPYEAAPSRDLHRLGPARHAEFFEQVSQVGLHRALADPEIGGNFLVRFAV